MIETLLVLLGAVALAGFFYWRWVRKTDAEIIEGAGAEWERLKIADPVLLEGLDEARFRTVYRRVHFPRFPKYALAIAAAFVIALPVTLSVLAGIALMLDSLGLSANAQAIAHSIPIEGSIAGVSRDQGEIIALYYIQDVAKFYYYFGLLFAWLAIVFVAMRRFHQRRPGYLREELMDEKTKG